MASNHLPLTVKESAGESADFSVIRRALALRDEANTLEEREEHEKAHQKIVEALRTMREAGNYGHIEFRAALAAMLYDLAEVHFELKDYKTSEKELEVLFKVLEALLKEDAERFGHWHVMALELSTRILRSRKKMLDLLAKQQINTGMLYEKVNSGVAAATDKLVDSLCKSARMLSSTGDYRGAVRFYMEALHLAKKRAGRVTRREVATTVELARVLMHSKSEQPRARRLLEAVLPHAVALEVLEFEQEIIDMIETIDKNVMHDPAWRTFLDRILHPRRRKGAGTEKDGSEDDATRADNAPEADK